MIKQKTLVWGLAVLGLLLVSGATALWPVDDSAAQTNSTDRELQGYAWSSNIGWISFNSDHPGGSKVTIKPDGKFVGYAWSPHIGWINFGEGSDTPLRGRGSGNGTESGVVDPLVRNPDDPRGSGRTGGGGSGLTSGGGSTSGPRFRSGVVLAKTGQVTGWARACSVFADGCTGPLKNNEELGDWDGWIGMSGSWSSGVRLDGNDLTGYAWGAENLGWVDFSGVSIKTDDIPTDLTVSCSITRGPDAADAYTGSLTSSVSGGDGNYSYDWALLPSGVIGPGSSPSGSWWALKNQFTSSFTVSAVLTVTDGSGSTGVGSCSIFVNLDTGGGDGVNLTVLPSDRDARIDRHDIGFPATALPPFSIKHDSDETVNVKVEINSSKQPFLALNDIATAVAGDPPPVCIYGLNPTPNSFDTEDPKLCNGTRLVPVAPGATIYYRITINKKLAAVAGSSPYNVVFSVPSNPGSPVVTRQFVYAPSGSYDQ